MTRHTALALAVLLLITSGCASARPSHVTAADATGSAAPGPDLAGTWRGTAFAVGGSNYLISTPVDVTINPDGTWSWSKRGQEQAKGRVTMRGHRLLLEEQTAKEGAQTIVLEQRGTELSGLSRAFIPGAISAVQLQKVQS
jgi:hypothetical protein